MNAECSKCGGDEWTLFTKVAVKATLDNDNEGRQERFDASDQEMTWWWRCLVCGYEEEDDDKA